MPQRNLLVPSAVFVAPILFQGQIAGEDCCRPRTTAQSDVECHGIARSLKRQLKGDVDHAATGVIISNVWRGETADSTHLWQY